MPISLNSVTFSFTVITLSCCISKNHAMGRENMLKSELQIQCETDKQCDFTGTNGYVCTDNKCTCTKGNCQETNISVDASVSKIGGPCKTAAQCMVENSRCKKEKCVCSNDTVTSLDKRNCLNVAAYGSACEENVQCSSFNGVCQDNKCICDKNKHFVNKTCYNSAELGAVCHKNEECYIEFSTCKDQICVCKSDYINSFSKSTCLLKAKHLGSLCVEDIQCKIVLGQGASCAHEVCKCMEMYRYDKDSNTCILDTLLGGRCKKHEECRQPNQEERRLECVLGECKCKSKYTEESGLCVLNSAKSSEITISKLFPYILSYILFLTIF